jgi:trans-aconitate methyltransferase
MKDRTSSSSTVPGQTWNTVAYAANGRFVANLASGVVNLLAPQAGEHILDLGCGDGALTELIAATGAIVTGVDASAAMVEAARDRGLRVDHHDATALPYSNEFDAVFSNAALHWIRNASAVLTGIHRSLRPGGRFVAEMGGHGNIAAIRVALQSVMANYGIDSEEAAASLFPSPDSYSRLIQAAGFRVESIVLIPRPTPLPSGMETWLNTFRNGVLDRLVPDERAEALARTVELLRPVLCDSDGNWIADYVRLRFQAIHI